MLSDNESGPEFETRARNIARAIHDPLGNQGAVMFQGKEHDGVYITDDSIHAYEFTLERKKDKAEKDSKKIASILEYLHRQPDHRYKSCTGWFVTKDDPTADQRAAVDREARKSGIPIHAISFTSLQGRLCDAEGYLRCRDNAPFGSTAYATPAPFPAIGIEPEFNCDGEILSVSDVSQRLLNGQRSLIVGEFGAGKSYAMRELYRQLRKNHLRSSGLTPFPLHINLRDCAGLRSPAEIFRRHAEEIGFPSERSLISAWRAGSCTLLLDGFDEIVPSRWMGSASDLREVRWQSLMPIRRIVQEAPDQTGIALCGRPYFFSSANEMHEAIGLAQSATELKIEDFNESQLHQFLTQSGITSQLPEWLPARPLLIGYLIATNSLSGLGEDTEIDQASAWRKLFELICKREAEILTAVRPDTIRRIISRVATLARSRGEEIGPINMEQIEKAFVDVNGRQPDEEGIQLLLRLPGLATTGSSSESESRVFVDRDLADTAYGEDLASYLSAPYAGHPLAQTASWVVSASQLGIDVASRSLSELSMAGGVARATANKRQSENRFDAVLADAIRVADTMLSSPESRKSSYLIEGVIFEYLNADDSCSELAKATLQDCAIEVLDISNLDNGDNCPSFHSCIVGYLDGAGAIPEWLESKFVECEIDRFSSQLQTTAGIMQLTLPAESRVALTILKKVYNQRGSGRRESALSRGIDLQSRTLVPTVLADLVSNGWLWRSPTRGEAIYLPVKGRRRDALHALDQPREFRIKA